MNTAAVSYTHLDVYKRQVHAPLCTNSFSSREFSDEVTCLTNPI